MNPDKRAAQNFALAASQKTSSVSSADTKYFEANKPKISLPPSDIKFPKYKCTFPEIQADE